MLTASKLGAGSQFSWQGLCGVVVAGDNEVVTRAVLVVTGGDNDVVTLGPPTVTVTLTIC